MDEPVDLIKTANHVNLSFSSEKPCEYTEFKPFVMDGFVSVSGERMPAKIY